MAVINPVPSHHSHAPGLFLVQVKALHSFHASITSGKEWNHIAPDLVRVNLGQGGESRGIGPGKSKPHAVSLRRNKTLYSGLDSYILSLSG